MLKLSKTPTTALLLLAGSVGEETDVFYCIVDLASVERKRYQWLLQQIKKDTTGATMFTWADEAPYVWKEPCELTWAAIDELQENNQSWAYVEEGIYHSFSAYPEPSVKMTPEFMAITNDGFLHFRSYEPKHGYDFATQWADLPEILVLPLTAEEDEERLKLASDLFGEEMFTALTPEIEKSKEYQRYNYLTKRYLNVLNPAFKFPERDLVS